MHEEEVAEILTVLAKEGGSRLSSDFTLKRPCLSFLSTCASTRKIQKECAILV